MDDEMERKKERTGAERVPSLTLWHRNFLLNVSTPVFKM